MKKIVCSFLALFLLASFAKAQTEKGDWLVGGSMTINTTKGNSEFTFQPSGGYFFANNFAAGAQLQLSFSKQEDTKYSAFSAGPFARYYINIKESALKPFFHADFNIGSTGVKVPGFDKTSTTTTSFFIGAGAAYFINNNVALEALAGYNRI
ncbi:MAG TPA: outer membrane beta-barrel protein, partial [Chitinophagaceae bacterium]|nr:outer membrane beta-barrel protein [Chitinophagaceae bacterium]